MRKDQDSILSEKKDEVPDIRTQRNLHLSDIRMGNSTSDGESNVLFMASKDAH